MEVFKVELLDSCYLQSNLYTFKQYSHEVVVRVEVFEAGSIGSDDTAGVEVDDITIVAI